MNWCIKKQNKGVNLMNVQKKKINKINNKIKKKKYAIIKSKIKWINGWMDKWVNNHIYWCIHK